MSTIFGRNVILLEHHNYGNFYFTSKNPNKPFGQVRITGCFYNGYFSPSLLHLSGIELFLERHLVGRIYNCPCGGPVEAYGLCFNCFNKAINEWTVISPNLVELLTSRSFKVVSKGEYSFYESRNAINLEDFAILPVPRPRFGNFFAVEDRKLTYSQNQFVNIDSMWRHGRQEVKPGKLVKHLLENRFIQSESSDSRFDNTLIELITSSISGIEVDLLVSEKPSEIYQLPTSCNIEVGTLGNSCMRPESKYTCNQGASMYDKLGAKILYAVKDEMLVGRAIIWDNAQTQDGFRFKFVDRIYGSTWFVDMVKSWAHKNGYGHKIQQRYDDPRIIMPDGSVIEDFLVSVGKHTGDFPYIDTLCYYDGQMLYSKHRDGRIQFQDASGVSVNNEMLLWLLAKRGNQESQVVPSNPLRSRINNTVRPSAAETLVSVDFEELERSISQSFRDAVAAQYPHEPLNIF